MGRREVVMVSLADDTKETEDHGFFTKEKVEILDSKFGQLCTEKINSMCDNIQSAYVLSWWLHDLRQSKVPLENSVEITDENPMVHRTRRLPPDTTRS